MAMITCPDCEKQISDQAPACPNCGRTFHVALTGVSNPYCKWCEKNGKKTALVKSTVKKVPGGANVVAIILLIGGICGTPFYGLGLIGILIAILIWSLGKTEHPALKCPEYNAVRML
jgi:hypothetical protein